VGDQRFRPHERLRGPGAYERVFQQGRKLVAPLFILHVLPTSEPHSRLGLAVSRRIGTAVARNRVKRRVREFFRRHKALLDPPCDVVVVARRGAAEASSAVYTQQFLTLLRHRLWPGRQVD
jgi:ribonuclease P protein component